MVPLLLSVGLCTAHERALTALRTRGSAVLNAGVSSGLSVLLLAFGQSAIFTTFFWCARTAAELASPSRVHPQLSAPPPPFHRLLLGVVVVGLFHALVVLPACLSLLPVCQPRYEDGASRDAQAVTVFSPQLEMSDATSWVTSSGQTIDGDSGYATCTKHGSTL
jgi:hypothetical protein